MDLPIGSKPVVSKRDLIVCKNARLTIKDHQEFQTSREIFPILNYLNHKIIDLAIRNAKDHKRITVMGRDIEAALNSLLSS